MVDPNNARVVYDIFGLRNLDFPGVKQRDKQLDEIAQMIQLKAPIPIELEVDDNYIHIACPPDLSCISSRPVHEKG